MRIFRYESWPTIMVIGAFFLGILFANLPNNGDWQPGWEMVSGLGTMFAAVVALYISGNEERRLKRQARDQAIVVASRIFLPLSTYAKEVRSCSDYFEEVNPKDIEYSKITDIQKKIERLLKEKAAWDTEIDKLIGLDNNTAAHIASAYGYLYYALNVLVQNEVTLGGSSFLPVKRSKEAVPLISAALSDASKLLEAAVFSCQSAAISLPSAHAGIFDSEVSKRL